MRTPTEYLADTSAWIRMQRGGDRTRHIVRQAIDEGLAWTCAPVRQEVLRGARNQRHLADLRVLLDLLPECPVRDSAWRRAEDVLGALVRRRGGRHRAVPPTDLLIAAAAEEQGLPVLHDDAHFDLIGEVTGQPMLRLR